MSAAPCAACSATAAKPASTLNRRRRHGRQPLRQLVANARDAREPAGHDHFARARRGHGERHDGLHGALEVRLPRQPAPVRARRRQRLGRRVRRAGNRCRAAREQQALGHGSGEKRHLAVERPGRARADRSRRSARRRRRCAPSSTASAAVNAPPSSSRMKDASRSRQPCRWACSRTASAATHTLSAVPMSTRLTFRCAGTDGRCTTPGVRTIGIGRARELAHQRPQSADAAGFARRRRGTRGGRRRRSAGGPRRSAGRSRRGRRRDRAAPRDARRSAGRRARTDRRAPRRSAANDRGTPGPSSSPQTSTLTVPGSIPITRGMTASLLRRAQDFGRRQRRARPRRSSPRRARDRSVRTGGRCTPCGSSS